jgi:hypothetical protein
MILIERCDSSVHGRFWTRDAIVGTEIRPGNRATPEHSRHAVCPYVSFGW